MNEKEWRYRVGYFVGQVVMVCLAIVAVAVSLTVVAVALIGCWKILRAVAG